ncbi:protease-like protein [Cricetulus griseus]|nr:protease-like protein [Cricetulus griseus]
MDNYKGELRISTKLQGISASEPVSGVTRPSIPTKERQGKEAYVEKGDWQRYEERVTERQDEESSFPTRNADEQKPKGRMQQELRGLKDLVESLSQEVKTLQVSSGQRKVPLSATAANTDQPKLQASLKPGQAAATGQMSPVQAIIREAADRGEDLQGFQTFPILEITDDLGNISRKHAPVQFKQLKELKMACVQYGPTAIFTQTLVENMAVEALPPGHWKQIAKTCLSGGDYLLWKTEFADQCQDAAEKNSAQGLPVSYEMLAGEREYKNIDEQLNIELSVYTQIAAVAKRAWNKLPAAGAQAEDLTKIRQGPDELFQDFVSRLMQASSRIVGDTEAGLLAVKQLAYENANAACQAALKPHRKKGDIDEFIKICADIGPAYTQGLAMAAALQGTSVKDMLFPQKKQDTGKKKGMKPSGGCFGYGQKGHRVRQCPNRGENREPGLCPRCMRGRHWAYECTSKRDAQGIPLQEKIPLRPRDKSMGQLNQGSCPRRSVQDLYRATAGSAGLDLSVQPQTQF